MLRLVRTEDQVLRLVRPEDQVLRQVASDVWCGRVVASWFVICVPVSGASDAQNAQNAWYYFC